MSEQPSGAAEAFAAELAEAGGCIGPVLEQFLPRGLNDFLSEALWHHLDSGGKRIRPAICLLTCERLGGDPAQALCFAAAVEMLHNMLLMHDDLEDADTIRRDEATVWVKYGLANAVNVGDYLLGAAYRAILSSPLSETTTLQLLRAFTEAYETTCRGQALDLNWRAKEDLTVSDYLEMVTLKTGRYLALGMVGAGIIAAADQPILSSFDQLGRSMGAAFQIRDDVIDLTVGKGRGGVTGNDIREGKASILYAHALRAAEPAERRELVAVMARPREDTTGGDVERVKGLYDKLGSLEFARAEADRLVEAAFETIERMPVADKAFFRRLTRYMVSRTE